MAKRFLTWALPGIVFTMGFGFAACSGGDATDPEECKPTGAGGMGAGAAGGGGSDAGVDSSGGAGGVIELPPGGDPETGKDGNNFHHPDEPATAGQKDPFEILKERADEGPPEVRSRLHSCGRIPFASIGRFLTSRGVNLDAKAAVGAPPTAGELYKVAGDALGAPNFDLRQGEATSYTIAGAIKLMDIFVQSAPEIIANIEKTPACKLAGQGRPMFDATTGKCVYSSVSCIMGRPATSDDMALCNLMLDHADPTNPADLANKRRITVAALLSAANTCE